MSPPSRVRRSRAAARSRPPVTSDGTARRARRGRRALPALRGRIDRGHRRQRADAGVDEAAPRAQRHPRDLGAGRHHQLRDARARAAAARLRRRLLDGAHRRALCARPGETLELLNGQTLDLEPDLLLVADDKKPLGPRRHHGRGATRHRRRAPRRVFLEGAFWSGGDPGQARRLGFATDAGLRFERGVDFDNGRARGRARDALIARDLRRPRRPGRRRQRRAAAARSGARAAARACARCSA